MPNDPHSEIPKSGRPLRVASFFSGAGGLDLGFDAAGFDIVFASDLNKTACETLKLNEGKALRSAPQVFCGDIRTLPIDALPANIDVVIGGPPCQPYSASGRRAGGAAGSLDSRGNLFQAYTSVIQKLQPSTFVFENVRGIFATNKGRDWADIVRTFLSLGYSLSFRLLDACDYGIPQHRERLFLVGHRLDGDFLFPRPCFGPDSHSGAPHVSLRQAFESIVEPQHLDTLALRDGKYSHLLRLVPPGGNYLHFTSKRGHPAPIFAYRSRFSDFLYKAAPERPSKTIIASPGKYTGPFHWDNRRFSIGEYKALQGFPQDYQFVGNRAEIVHQIGNSVSPLVAFQLARAIQSQIFNIPVPVDLLSVDERLTFDKRKSKLARGTRETHEAVALKGPKGTLKALFEATAYVTTLSFPGREQAVLVQAVAHSKRRVSLTIKTGKSATKMISMSLTLGGPRELSLFAENDANDFILDVELSGIGNDSIQSMWDAVDDWVIRSSSFHSLYELYGHFTEPHPIFEVVSFIDHSQLPICKFARHLTNFSNCSQYFPRDHLSRMFGSSFGTHSFADLVRMLRGYRFDVRCHETNIAIDPDLYMVCYPFTLPARKQMNFNLKDRSQVVQQYKLAV